MKSPDNEHEAMEKIFNRAYVEKEKLDISDHWQLNVMRRIRNLGPVDTDTFSFIRFEKVVWRLTPAVCLLILILGAVLFRFEIVPESGLFQVLLNGEEELSISQFMGL